MGARCEVCENLEIVARRRASEGGQPFNSLEVPIDVGTHRGRRRNGEQNNVRYFLWIEKIFRECDFPLSYACQFQLRVLEWSCVWLQSCWMDAFSLCDSVGRILTMLSNLSFFLWRKMPIFFLVGKHQQSFIPKTFPFKSKQANLSFSYPDSSKVSPCAFVNTNG